MASSAVEEIKARLDVAELIGSYVALKRSGRSFRGLCPFHGEKTPSFYAFPETGTWKCFGCGEGGDVFTFIQKRENIDFGEALLALAGRAGVQLPSRERRAPEVQEALERLLSVLAAAEMYFKATLAGSGGAAAREYLRNRDVNADSVERFGLGYAPSRGLLRFLQDQGFTPGDAVQGGVAGQRDGGTPFEMFRERLIFPIRDAGGRTIGFGGRLLGDGQPKYLNGPQTELFDIGGSLFGLDLARPAIRQSGQVVIVEGYLDAIMAHQHGFQNVVATLGTALTERHLDLLGKRAAVIILALDADAAGQAATLRGLEVAQQAVADGVVPVPNPRGWVRYQAIRQSQIKILSLPAGLDPDELIRRDAAEWSRLVTEASPVVDYLLNRLGERYDLASARGKQEAVQEAMGVLRDLVDPVEREHYLQRLAGIVGIDESGLRLAFGRGRRRPLPPPTGSRPAEVEALPEGEAYILGLAFLAAADGPAPAAEDFSSPEARALLQLFLDLSQDQRTTASFRALADSVDVGFRPAMTEIAAHVERAELLDPDVRRRELEVAVLRLRQRRLRIQHLEALALASDAPEAIGGVSPLSMLTAIAGQLREIEAALAARDGVGSVVWRSRQAGEVLGG